MKTVKAFLQTLCVLGAVALTIALVYFLTITIGFAILAVFIFICIREYNRESKLMAEKKKDPE